MYAVYLFHVRDVEDVIILPSDVYLFRKNLAEPALCRLRHELTEALLQLQLVKISPELQDRLVNTPTRLRIRLQLCNKQPKRLFKATNEPVLPAVLVPWNDPVRNEFNQLVFTAFVPPDSTSTDQ
ncbi:hypothetical protein ANCDUO_14480 [Ancylostoma duodenale]|uniref:Uncharacterized protein n=1 Tax=Ancylostoma duodenale TaxID=51022 RepID=A0A0C2G959_9BILA|nr:hypothetical protein ANCDUO_14480 [Ancylostoma duodenale]